eukprot:11296704-Alexandrium_andersonii.AAC.1
MCPRAILCCTRPPLPVCCGTYAPRRTTPCRCPASGCSAWYRVHLSRCWRLSRGPMSALPVATSMVSLESGWIDTHWP